MAFEKKTIRVRYDSHHTRLNTGEYQRANGTYAYRWTGSDKKRHYVYAKTLDELRKAEKQIQQDKEDGIRDDMSNCTVNEIFELWKQNKRGLRDKTRTSYFYFYDLFVRPNFGQKRIQKVKRSDVRAFYNNLIEVRGIKTSTLDNVHTVLHQVFQLAVDDDIIRKNPTSMMMKEIKAAFGNDAAPKKALTRDEEYLFFSEILKRPNYRKWFPLLFIMANTGMRVGEITGLRWCDVDLENGYISVNHTLVYFDHHNEYGCNFTIHRPKTEAGNRMIPIIPSVKKAFLMQKEYMELTGLKSVDHIDGYDDFIFVNRFGKVHNQSTVNAAIHRMIKDINLEIIDKMGEDDEPVVVPHFSCHILRHTFCTRLMQMGVNIRIIQAIMGHQEFSTTMDIYVDVTGQMEYEELSKFNDWLDFDDKLIIINPGEN